MTRCDDVITDHAQILSRAEPDEKVVVRKSLLYLARGTATGQLCLPLASFNSEVIGTDGRATGRAVINFLDGWEAIGSSLIHALARLPSNGLVSQISVLVATSVWRRRLELCRFSQAKQLAAVR